MLQHYVYNNDNNVKDTLFSRAQLGNTWIQEMGNAPIQDSGSLNWRGGGGGTGSKDQNQVSLSRVSAFIPWTVVVL